MNSDSTTEIPAQYRPSDIEKKWYAWWEENGFFHSEPDDREPYTIVIPPPNVTGVLHMGHMLNNTIQDVLVRRARMLGKNACWVPGTDHASIATEAKVVNRLREQGITKGDLTREEFLEHAWQWTEEHGGVILQQLRELGASCDWQRTRFTLEDDLYDSVIDCFIELHERGHIYRGKRMINWDPQAQTALSDEEVIHREVTSRLYHIRYEVEGESDGITIATTRPETILADTAVCVHPGDDRYRHLVGKTAIIPLIGRRVPVIADDYVDPEYGTGCLKITPAHDLNDYEIGQRHGLEVIDMLEADGTLSEAAQRYVGRDRFEARKLTVADLEKDGHLVRSEEIANKVGYSERTDAVIEPRLSLQWFMRMEEIAAPALENVLNGEIDFHPDKFKNSYRHWMENIRDWCISRQLWWGQRIPAWYYGEDAEEYVIAKTGQEAVEKAREKTGNGSLAAGDLRQDEDVLDTWFSSWLWPITVFDGFREPDNEEIEYYYPTNDLVTAPEIMFFWVARMIMAGYEFRGEKPFSNVYYTGIVRDSQRRKMSKSLGNSPDPLELIGRYGADGVRTGMLFSSPAGNDLLFEEKLCEQGRNFANKIWNAFRFLMMNRGDDSADPAPSPPADSSGGMKLIKDLTSKLRDNIKQAGGSPEPENLADRWMRSRLHETIRDVNADMDSFRINEALRKIYSLIWDDFCDWYIELVKADESGASIPADRLNRALGYFEQLMKLLHPFMPFITEEVWQHMRSRRTEEAMIVAQWPEFDEEAVAESDTALFETIQKMISAVRNIRAEFRIGGGSHIGLLIKAKDEATARALTDNEWMFRKLQNIDRFEVSGDVQKPEGSASAVVEGSELFVPLEGLTDLDKERERIEKEIERLEGFLQSVLKKLENRKFVDNAPDEVVQRERDKREDTENSLRKLRGLLSELA